MNRSTDSLKEFIASSGSEDRFRPRPGVIVVGSGKGGVGTSVIVALLGLQAMRQGEHVLLVDADEAVGPSISCLESRIRDLALAHCEQPASPQLPFSSPWHRDWLSFPAAAAGWTLRWPWRRGSGAR